MFKNYFKIAVRNVLKNKTSSFINITGLAIGMAVALLIGLWVWDEISFDKNNKNYDRIAQVMQHQTVNGNVGTFSYTPLPIGKELQNSFSGDFKYVVMSSFRRDHILTYKEQNLSGEGIFMDVGAPDMLALNMLEGTRDGLKDPHAVLISSTMAKAIFKDKDALNNLIKIDNKLAVKVAGVYEDLPVNNSFQNIGFIAPWDLYKTSEQWIINAEKDNKWDNNSFQTYVQIGDNSNFETVNKKIIDCKQIHVDAEDKKYQSKIFLNPMRDWHLRSHWDNNGIKEGGQIAYVRLFTIIGIFILLLACINFMNLSTARSEKRAKEVGIRKSIGSFRSQIIGLFYGESLLIVTCAFIVAVLLTQFTLPFFNEIAKKAIAIPYSNPLFWLIGICFTIITAILAGSYPALYLSSFNPVKVLKGTFKAGKFTSLPRKVLVVLQFTISIALIVGTIVIYEEVQYTRDRPIGYNRDGLMMIQMKSPDFYGKFDVLNTDFKNSGAVSDFAESSSEVTSVTSTNDGFTWPGKDPGLDVDFATLWVTHDFGKTVGWQFKEGRDFSKDFKTDSFAIVINEAAVKFMGLKNPVGTQVAWDGKNYRIIGIIKDMLMESPFDPVKQTIYFMDDNNVNYMILKLNPNESTSSSVAKIASVFKKNIPSAPFDYKFADAEFAAKFAAEEQVGTLSACFATLAIFICCLGLFGMASFMAEQRTKEIGVRKVLGATVFNVWRLLNKEFILLVIISLLIAIPIAYYLMHNWLQGYQYKIGISWWIFFIVGAGALLITLFTVSFQSIKAAIANPVKSLKSE